MPSGLMELNEMRREQENALHGRHQITTGCRRVAAVGTLS